MTTKYALEGSKTCPQVEPEASYWLECPVLRTVSTAEVLGKIEIRPYPISGSKEEREELEQLHELVELRDKRFRPDFLSKFLTEEKYFKPPPARAILRYASVPVIERGIELATLFEAETPGLWFRHVLDILFDPGEVLGACQVLSPPRQALVWAALDLSIASALSIAWQIKWLQADGKGWRPRPKETDPSLDVLFDYITDRRQQPGKITRNELKHDTDKIKFPKWPGTPRHPAYTSGHSTYSGAAAHVLGCFFLNLKGEFYKLANDIGNARLWGGVHWRSDHVFGLEVGHAVGQLIIDQLNASGIVRDFKTVENPPMKEKLEQEAAAFRAHCGQGHEDYCKGVIPKRAGLATLSADAETGTPIFHTVQLK